MTKICIIDDSLSVCMAVERMLSAKGYNVISEKSGLSAVVNMERELPDLVISDVILPDIEGFRICTFIKQHPRLSSIPVLMISGIVDDEVEDRTREVGAEGLLRKPFSAENLLGEVERLLAQRTAAASTAAPREIDPSSVAEDIRPLMLQLSGIRELRYASILQADGSTLVSVGEVPEDAEGLDHEFARAIELGRSLCERHEHGSFKTMILEGDQGVFLLRPLTAEYTLLMDLRDRLFLGKARLLIGKLAAPLRLALAS